MTLSVEVQATHGPARATTITTARGTVTTPCFMPVGTRGVVRAVETEDLEALGAQIVLGNTYHLLFRPGPEVVEGLGGIHGFSDWGGHVLTDSGGYQVFSLSPRVDDDGRSEEHTSELQSLMRISYAVFCLKKNNTQRK